MKKMLKIIITLSIIIPVNILTIRNCGAEIREELILNRPIVEGKSIAGINIGDHESDIYKAIGFPDKLESDFLAGPELNGGLKLLVYTVGEGGVLLIYTRHQRVDAIWLFGYPGKFSYQGKTTKGVGLGDSSDLVKRKYGLPEQEGMWGYKKYGIAFGVDEKGIVGGVLIRRPNTDLSDYMRMRP